MSLVAEAVLRAQVCLHEAEDDDSQIGDDDEGMDEDNGEQASDEEALELEPAGPSPQEPAVQAASNEPLECRGSPWTATATLSPEDFKDL